VNIFIAGCARSGTTLMVRLMSSFGDTYALVDSEEPFNYFSKVEGKAKNLVIKRDTHTHKTLAQLPADIELIYMIRHPFDVLTSYHPDFPNRKYYVREARWRAEYAALKALCAAQPMREIAYVEYSDLVTNPDTVQEAVGKRFDLTIIQRFSEMDDKISTESVGKYKRQPELLRYLNRLPYDFRAEIKDYCDRFDHELPQDYVRKASRAEDSLRRFVVRQMARNWRHKLNPFARG
jgi:hypothetical protein